MLTQYVVFINLNIKSKQHALEMLIFSCYVSIVQLLRKKNCKINKLGYKENMYSADSTYDGIIEIY